MKVEPDTTNYTVKALKVIRNTSDRVKVMKNISKEGDVYFLVVHEPPVDEITCPEDITTVRKFKVGESENRFAIRQQALEQAEEYWKRIKPDKD